MRAAAPIIWTLAALLGAQGCARLMVVDPRRLPELNDAEWQVRRRGAPPKVTQTVAATSSPPAPTPADRDDALLRSALATPRDAHGIPVGLYDYDPMLRSYDEVARARASSHRVAGAGALSLGLLLGGATGFLLWWAGDEYVPGPTGMVLFSLDALAAIGFIGAGIVELATPPDRQALRRYANETYDLP